MPPWNEPLRKYRYLVDLNGIRTECKSVQLPEFLTDINEYKLINHNIKIPGIGNWGDCILSFIATETLLQKTFLRIPGYSSTGATLSKYRFSTPPRILIFDGGGAPINGPPSPTRIVQTWTLHGAFVSSINFGDLAYESDDIIEVEMTISLDYASIS